MQQLSNEDIELTIYRHPECAVEFVVKASAALVAAAQKRAVKAIGKEVTLPGFRKGKAPDHFILKNFPSDVDRKWQEEIANKSFQEGQKLASIPLVNADAKVSFKMKHHSLEGAELSLTFETLPKVPTIDTSKIELKEVKRPEVNDEKIENTIRQIQLFFATWTPITDRPVQEGDFVMLDVDVIEDQPPTSLFSGVRFEVTEKSMAKWMLDMVLGQNVDAVVEGVSVPDETASAEDKEALKPKKVRLHIKAIEEPKAPPIDDKFASMVGASSLEDLRQKIETLLTSQADAHVQERLREQINDFILENYLFDLPSSLIERETIFRMRELMKDPAFQKYWNEMSQEDRKKTFDSIADQSKKAVCMFYLCRQILSDAKISISEKDIPAAPTTALEMLLSPQPHLLHPNAAAEVKQAEVYSRLILEKAQDYLISKAAQKV